ncbi:MAG TPA: DUF5691 domain-containing protein, partial [Planctomycetia bacterium]|nr:DUF5691 domain-containing protein [Planctomycetia bacterium]
LDVAPPATRDRALAILGERGRWLAGENPAWEWASRSLLDAAPSESDWHEGPPPRRAAYLASLRAADPPAARLVLESSWKTEKADARIEFLALLQTGLSAADLPFLETALADRSDRVADEAARLCALLPDSPQSTFLRDRASEILESPLKGRCLDFSAPQTYLDAFADVFRQSKPKDPVARRKLNIQRTLASAPVDVWTRRLGLKPALLFAAIDPAELADVAGRWLDAAAVQHRSDWLLAFLDSLVAGAFSKAGFAADGLAARALSGLSPTELLGRYSALVDYWAREGVGPVEDLLQWPPFRPTWSEAQSAEIVPAVRQAFVRSEALAASRGRIEENPALCTLIELAAFGVPIAEAPALLAQFRTEDLPLEVAAALKPAQRHAYDRMRSGLEVVREIVELRLLLHRELSAAPPAPAKESS